MRRLKAFNANQERWSHNGRVYSIIDLTKWPETAAPMPAGSNYEELMRQHYQLAPFELAEQTDDNVNVIQRFETIDQARDFIREWGGS